jgi:Methyltransferase domain
LPPQTFDLIVLSHTLEHVVNLQEISAIRNLLVPGGFLYIEVPDASRYADFPRREYLYYIDRLHINHFTPASLSHLLKEQGMFLTWVGRHDFQYKDDRLYPACCVLATTSAVGRTAISGTTPLADALPRYLRDEAQKARTWRQHLVGDRQPAPPILVYGFGDNFFRALNPDGPLAGLHVQAIVDQRWQSLRQSGYAGAYHFIGPPEVVDKYARSPIVITVSFGGEAIAQKLRDAGCQHVFIL